MDTVVIEPMRLDDLDAVHGIEARSVPQPWPVDAYLREIEMNPGAAWFVARLTTATPSRPAWLRETRWGARPGRTVIAGFAGLVMQHDEAHISMMAVDPAYRRRHIGERLLVWLIHQAIARNARVLSLEVRPSNHAATRLYTKYGLAVVGRRPRYYPDNDEDALIMTSPPLDDPAWRARLRALESTLPR